MAVAHKIRTKTGKTRKVSLTPLSAIRAFCLECVCWSRGEVKKCTDPLCPLYPFRSGKNPSRAGIGGKIKGNLS
jgi:hypothetical protein